MGFFQHTVRRDVDFLVVYSSLSQRSLIRAVTVIDLALDTCRGINGNLTIGINVDFPEAALIVADIGIVVLTS